MIRTNEELYAIVTGLCRTMTALGEHELSAGLRDAMEISSLPGEVLGEMRPWLLRVRRTKASQRVYIRGSVEEAVRYIDSVLGPRD